MSRVTDLYEELHNCTEGKEYLTLAKLFSCVFGRKIQRNEWGLLRKLITLYGSELMYWAMLKSAHLTNTSNPLIYVSRVCSNSLAEEVKERSSGNEELRLRTKVFLESYFSYEKPDWSKILGGGMT